MGAKNYGKFDFDLSRQIIVSDLFLQWRGAEMQPA